MGAAEELTAGDLIRHWTDQGEHRHLAVCPGCRGDLLAVGLTELAYVFLTCECNATNYAHLVEQLWHRSCLAAAPVDAP